jgi:hypothetical protein
MENSFSLPKLTDYDFNYSTHDEWLENTESYLKELGYRKFNQKTQNEDFAYWKSFYDTNGEKIYQSGVFFYDFRKYGNERIGVQFECMFINIGARLDLSVCKDITILHFEKMSEVFYNAMKSTI